MLLATAGKGQENGAALLREVLLLRYLKELEGSQWWPREQLQDVQSRRLQRLIRHAYDHVPYYRRVMDERGVRPIDVVGPSDLTRLPVLTKDDIRTHGGEMV